MKTKAKKASPETTAAVITYIHSEHTHDDFVTMRKAIDATSRCTAWYQNDGGGKSKGMTPSACAEAVMQVARDMGHVTQGEMPRPSWCGNYPRTKKSQDAQREGEAILAAALAFIAAITL